MLLRVLKKFNRLLTRHQKIRVIELGVLMVIGGFLEMLSVSIMLPLMNAIMNPEEVMAKWYSQIVCNIFRISDPNDFMVFICVAFAVLYIVKNVYLILEQRVQNRFVYNNLYSVKNRLLHNYLFRPYEYFLNVRSSDVIRVINNDTELTFRMLSTILQLFTELVVSIAVSSMIFFISPLITSFVAIVLIVLVILIVLVLKPIMNKAGKNSQKSRSEMNKWLLQSIQGIRELKVMQKEDYFENNFRDNGKRLTHTLLANNFYSNVPRMLLESVSMSSIFVMIAFMIRGGADLSGMIPALTAIAMAAIRLLPSANRISSAMASVAYSEPMLDKCLENMKGVREEEKRVKEEAAKEDHVINGLSSQFELKGITYRYPEGNSEVLQNAGMTVKKGEVIGIAGPSGAGKSTTVDILLGLLKPQEGDVLVDGISISKDPKGWLSQIGYIPQTIFLLDGTIRSNVAFGIPEDKVSDEEVYRALEEASMLEFVKSLPDGIDTQIGERGIRLSGGQRQRIGIARALYLNPEVLIMDEATSALDNATEQEIMDSIHNLQGKKTIVIIAHRLSTLEFCDRIYTVDKGSITDSSETPS